MQKEKNSKTTLNGAHEREGEREREGKQIYIKK